jgi:hypothetical protein
MVMYCSSGARRRKREVRAASGIRDELQETDLPGFYRSWPRDGVEVDILASRNVVCTSE